MYHVTVLNSRGEVVNDIECLGFNIQYSQAHDDGKVQTLRSLMNAKYDNKYWIKNEFYTSIATKLVFNINEFRHINPTKILFIEDVETKENLNKTPEWIFKISKANKHLRILTGYKWIIESKECWVSALSESHIVAHIYNMMKYIDEDGGLKKPDIIGWKELIGGFGYGWESSQGELPRIYDILENIADKEDFDMLRKANKQVSFFEPKLVK